jgi:hypothetical protein
MLTKALSRDVFERHREMIMNEPQDEPSGQVKVSSEVKGD